MRSQSKHQIQNQESKDNGWRFNQYIPMTLRFFKTTELNGSSHRKNPKGSSAILNSDNDDKYCFIWSILAHLHPIEDSKNGQPTRE